MRKAKERSKSLQDWLRNWGQWFVSLCFSGWSSPCGPTTSLLHRLFCVYKCRTKIKTSGKKQYNITKRLVTKALLLPFTCFFIVRPFREGTFEDIFCRFLAASPQTRLLHGLFFAEARCNAWSDLRKFLGRKKQPLVVWDSCASWLVTES